MIYIAAMIMRPFVFVPLEVERLLGAKHFGNIFVVAFPAGSFIDKRYLQPFGFPAAFGQSQAPVIFPRPVTGLTLNPRQKLPEGVATGRVAADTGGVGPEFFAQRFPGVGMGGFCPGLVSIIPLVAFPASVRTDIGIVGFGCIVASTITGQE